MTIPYDFVECASTLVLPLLKPAPFFSMKDRATIVCLQRGRILLVTRDRSRWALPGGSIKRGETPLDGAVRDLAEETNLSLERVEYQFLFGGLTKRHHVFVVDVPEDVIATARNEIARCHWFDCKQVSTITASIPTRKIVELVFHNAAIVHPPE